MTTNVRAMTSAGGGRYFGYVFRGGEIRKDDRSAAVTHIDSLGYHFHTLSGRPYGWTFRRLSPDRWTARLSSTNVYTMDRIKR